MRSPGSSLALQPDDSTSSNSRRVNPCAQGQGWERSQDQVRPLRAALDKRRSERKDLLRRERGVERLGDGNHPAGGADKGLVAGLDGEDGAGGGEDGAVGDEGGGAEVGRYTHVLEDGGGGDHAGGVGEAEVVCARLDGLDAGLGEGGLEKHDVLLFGLADLGQVLDLALVKAEGLEVGDREAGEALLVEGCFEPFEGEGAGG